MPESYAVYEEVSQTLSVDVPTADVFMHMIDRAIRAMFVENYARGDFSCWPHMFLLRGAREMVYARIELGPQEGYAERMGTAIIDMSLTREARFYAFLQEYAFSSTIMECNALLVQVGEVGPGFPAEHQVYAKAYWVSQADGSLVDASLGVDEFNKLVRLHKATPLKRGSHASPH